MLANRNQTTAIVLKQLQSARPAKNGLYKINAKYVSEKKGMSSYRKSLTIDMNHSKMTNYVIK